MIARVDTIVGRLMDSIVEVGMGNCVNLMVVSDHGMANTACDDQNLPNQLYNLNNVSRPTLFIMFSVNFCTSGLKIFKLVYEQEINSHIA